MKILVRIWKKTKEVGFLNCLTGAILRLRYQKAQKKYGFDKWHFSPYEWKKNLQETAKYINANNAETVVDIGCGLGGLLKHINAPVKIGIDIHEEVILAAKELNGESIKYRVGSFDDVIHEVDREKAIDYLITFGFTHGGTEKTWITPYHTVAKKNDIKHFIVDTMPEDGTSHHLDYSKILPENYTLIERMGPFLGGRCVEVWEKQK